MGNYFIEKKEKTEVRLAFGSVFAYLDNVSGEAGSQ